MENGGPQIFAPVQYFCLDQVVVREDNRADGRVSGEPLLPQVVGQRSSLHWPLWGGFR